MEKYIKYFFASYFLGISLFIVAYAAADDPANKENPDIELKIFIKDG